MMSGEKLPHPDGPHSKLLFGIELRHAGCRYCRMQLSLYVHRLNADIIKPESAGAAKPDLEPTCRRRYILRCLAQYFNLLPLSGCNELAADTR